MSQHDAERELRDIHALSSEMLRRLRAAESSLAELRRRVVELEREFLAFRNVCSSRETHREFYLGRASGFDSAADHIRAILAATEPPQAPPARDPEQRVDAPGPPIVCECCQLSTDLYVTPQNLGTAPDELLAWVCRTCIKRLGIHIVAAVVRDRRSVSTITTLRAELEQARSRVQMLEANMREVELALGFDEPHGITLAQARELRRRADASEVAGMTEEQVDAELRAVGVSDPNGMIARMLERQLRDTKSELSTVAAERDAARTALARLRAKAGPVVEWWRAYTPAGRRGIVPELARRLDVLRSGWEETNA